MTTIFSFQPKQNDPLLTNRQKFFLPTQITTKKIKWTTVHENVSCGRTQTAQTFLQKKTQTSNLYGQHTNFSQITNPKYTQTKWTTVHQTFLKINNN